MVNRQQPIANRQSQIANQESLLLSCQAVISGKINVEFDYFYAKQTQFTERSNEPNLIYNKPLRKCSSPRTPQKQSQNKPNSKPIKANFKRNTLYEYANKPKQTQFQTFCWRCHTEKIMLFKILSGKCHIDN